MVLVDVDVVDGQRTTEWGLVKCSTQVLDGHVHSVVGNLYGRCCQTWRVARMEDSAYARLCGTIVIHAARAVRALGQTPDGVSDQGRIYESLR